MRIPYYLRVAVTVLSALYVQPCFAAFDSADFNEKQLRITSVTPSGEDVPAGRQIVFQFNRPVVPVGRMDRNKNEIPIQVSPKLNCQWRWLNSSALACQLDEQNTLKYATKYSITMRPGIKAEDGSTIERTYKHQFTTELPKVYYAWINRWESPGAPVVRLTFNQSVSKSSVAKYVSFQRRIGIDGKVDLKFAVHVDNDPNDREAPRYIMAPGESYVLDLGESEKIKSDDGLKRVNGEEARRVWLISPKKELPLDSNVDLRIAPGLASALGKEKGAEDRGIINFDTFPEFKFLGVTCTTNKNQKVLITNVTAEPEHKCDPLQMVSLTFSSPVLGSQIKKRVLFSPDLAGGRKDYDPWANHQDYSQLGQAHKHNNKYYVWLPERLKAAQSYTIQLQQSATDAGENLEAGSKATDSIFETVEDEFGRKLKKPIDFTFFTDHRRPNFKLVHNTAVLESQIDSDIPLYITNLKEVSFDYKTLTSVGKKDAQSLSMHDFSHVQDIQFPIPMKVRDLLGGKSGVIYGSIKTEPQINKYHGARVLYAMVSPYQLHVKIGYFNTMVWVTDLATGKPVNNAKVTIYKDSINNLSDSPQALDTGKTDKFGIVLLKGTAELDPNLELFKWCRDDQDACNRVFVRIDKGKDMALMPLDSRFEVNSYRISNYKVGTTSKKKFGHIHTWGTTAQGVYRAGSAIEYKFYVRNQNNNTYIPAPAQTYKLEIIDPAGKVVHEMNALALSEFGSYSGEYTVPENASVGWYRFKLSANFITDDSWQPMRVLVSDFTPASFKVSNSLNGDMFHPDDEVEVISQAKLHSGGAYTDAEARITATLQGRRFSTDHPVANGFVFDTYKKRQTRRVFQKIDVIGDEGEIAHKFILPKTNIVYGRLKVESSIRDDRGKYIAANSSADYIAVDRLVGLKNTKWMYEAGKKAAIKYIVVDEHGAPASDTSVDIRIQRLETTVARVKGAGNAYLTKYQHKWISSENCSGISTNAALICEFTPKDPGTYKFIASISDTKGNKHSTEIRAWVAGKGQVIWTSPNDHSLAIIPEKTAYNIGDKARYLIKNPYPGAHALISIERYGVLKSWVQVLQGSTPVIAFDIDKAFMPGFYLSVTVVSPRVAKPLPGIGQVDLGKPAFKAGYVKVPVKDPYKQIDVTITTDARLYKPRDTVTAKIHAKPKHKGKKENIEIAVVVLDEAVLDLIQGGKKYFDPYDGFYKLDDLDLRNYSLLTRLVGRQKIEKKGANPGGDGGASISMRSLFKFVSYWNPSVKADRKGNATIHFKVPDNLTGWRILAFAVTPSDRMGLGDTRFKVNRPTEIRPVMPNQVTESDSFKAGFSVMNRTGKPRDIEVRIKAEGAIVGSETLMNTVHLEAYKRKTIFFPVKTVALAQNRNTRTGEIRFTATASDNVDSDGIKHTVAVKKRRSLETAASYGTTIQDHVTALIKVPANIYQDVGDISVVLSPSVIGNVDGAFRYMRDYPYHCWEQKLSKAVMASHYQGLKSYLPDDLIWKASKALPANTLKQAANFQAPNGGMTYFIPQDQYVSPYLSAYTALAFNWMRDNNEDIPVAVENRLHAYLERLLRKDIAPTFYSREMLSTVRAVALAALAAHGKVSIGDLTRYRPYVQYMSLFGKAHYLQAALKVKGAQAIAKEVVDLILASSNQSGGKFKFNEELDDSYVRILATPLRANCSVLSAFTAYGEKESGAQAVGDIPYKLVRSIAQTRGNRDHWENTQENIFCMNSLVDYSRIYENTKPDMHVSIAVNDELIGQASFKDLRDNTTIVSRPISSKDTGKKQTVNISREGAGRLYYATRVSYAPLDEQAVRLNAGIDIRKEYSVERHDKWELLDRADQIKRGELVRVDIYLSLPAARNFVVVDDPVPGGLEPVNRDLANTSLVDADKGGFQASGGAWWFQFDDWHHYNVSRWSFYHKELRHDAVRFYSDYLPAGNYHLSYAAQAIAEGDFTMMPVHAEEMYDPDVFGKGLPGTLHVRD